MTTTIDLDAQLTRVQEWIKAADQKVSILLAFQGVVLVLVYNDLSGPLKPILFHLPWWQIVLLVATVILLGLSVQQSTAALVPRLDRGRTPRSFTYFGDIAELDLAGYRKRVAAVDASRYEEELTEQIHTCAVIATKKHVFFRNAILSFAWGMATLLVLAVSLLCRT